MAMSELGAVYQARGRTDLSQQAYAEARTVVEQIAERMTSASMREKLLQLAEVMIPSSQPSTQLQELKQRYSGLTRRERQVATLVAEGFSNQAALPSFLLSPRLTYPTQNKKTPAKRGV